MSPRAWVATLLVAAAAAVTVVEPAAGLTPTTARATTKSPPPPVATPTNANNDLNRPLPRQPAAMINATACLIAYRSSGDARAYLCCIDRSMGFCKDWLEPGPDESLCTIDWKPYRPPGGRQCCFRAKPAVAAPGGGPPTRPRVGIDGKYGAGVSPRLEIECRAYGRCTRTDVTRGVPAGERYAAAEKVTRCGSYAPKVYRRCQVTLCETKRRPRIVRPPVRERGGVKFCSSRSYGTPAACCLRRANYWDRVKCCSKCKGPSIRGKSLGCCWAGPRPKGKAATGPQNQGPRRKWRRVTRYAADGE